MSVLLGDDLSWSHQWEAEILSEVLRSVTSLNLRILDNRGLDDLDVASHSSVSTSHIVVHLTDGTSESQVSVLLVHIVCTTSASVTEPDGEVLDLSWGLIEDLGNVKDLASSSLCLCQGFHVVPELRLGNYLVTSEDLHSENLWAWVLGSWSSATNKLVEMHLRG